MSKESVIREIRAMKAMVDQLPRSSSQYPKWAHYVDNARQSLRVALEMKDVKDETYLQGVVNNVRKGLKNVDVDV